MVAPTRDDHVMVRLLSSRKFVVVASTFLTCVMLLLAKAMPVEVFADVVKLIVGSYIAAVAVEDGVEKWGAVK